jgi:hypothetical protein
MSNRIPMKNKKSRKKEEYKDYRDMKEKKHKKEYAIKKRVNVEER